MESAQGQADHLTGNKSTEVAHVVNAADNAAAETGETEHEIQYGKTDGAADNGFFLAAGDIQFAEFHAGDYSSHDPKYGAGCAQFTVLRIIGDA